MNVILYIFRSILFRARIALGMRLLYISYKGMGRIVRLRNSSCIFGRDTQKLIEKKDVIKPFYIESTARNTLRKCILLTYLSLEESSVDLWDLFLDFNKYLFYTNESVSVFLFRRVTTCELD